jgi:hypothetical protein
MTIRGPDSPGSTPRSGRAYPGGRGPAWSARAFIAIILAIVAIALVIFQERSAEFCGNASMWRALVLVMAQSTDFVVVTCKCLSSFVECLNRGPIVETVGYPGCNPINGYRTSGTLRIVLTSNLRFQEMQKNKCY